MASPWAKAALSQSEEGGIEVRNIYIYKANPRTRFWRVMLDAQVCSCGHRCLLGELQSPPPRGCSVCPPEGMNYGRVGGLSFGWSRPNLPLLSQEGRRSAAVRPCSLEPAAWLRGLPGLVRSPPLPASRLHRVASRGASRPPARALPRPPSPSRSSALSRSRAPFILAETCAYLNGRQKPRLQPLLRRSLLLATGTSHPANPPPPKQEDPRPCQPLVPPPSLFFL